MIVGRRPTCRRGLVLDHVGGMKDLRAADQAAWSKAPSGARAAGRGPGHGQGVVGVVVDEQAEAAEAEQGRLGGRPGVEGLERGRVADPVDRVDVREAADRDPADRPRVGQAGRPARAARTRPARRSLPACHRSLSREQGSSAQRTVRLGGRRRRGSWAAPRPGSPECPGRAGSGRRRRCSGHRPGPGRHTAWPGSRAGRRRPGRPGAGPGRSSWPGWAGARSTTPAGGQPLPAGQGDGRPLGAELDPLGRCPVAQLGPGLGGRRGQALADGPEAVSRVPEPGRSPSAARATRASSRCREPAETRRRACSPASSLGSRPHSLRAYGK